MEYNENVKKWQGELLELGKDLGSAKADGKFGPKTLNASLSLIGAPPVEVPPAPVTYKVICTANSRVNVRDGRGGDYRQYEDIGDVLAGQVVESLEEDLNQEYIKIVWGGGVGYAYCNNGKYFKHYAEEAVTSDKIKAVLDVIKQIATPIGGINAKYVFGGEGQKITRALILAGNKKHPEYYSNGRLSMLLKIADECEAKGEWIWPIHYVWDCSGLWWEGANRAKLYGDKEVDSTAAGVYKNYCTPIKKSELRPGDLPFYKSASAGKITHMAIVGYGRRSL